MKRVVNGGRWWHDWLKNTYYQSLFMRPVYMRNNNKY